MGDFVKELNIIDFLGMMLPGAAFILIFSYGIDTTEQASLLFSYFENQDPSASQVILLIIAGYVLGMLIHEIGDLMEKFCWGYLRIDPRAYAAKAVNINGELIKACERAKVLKGQPYCETWKDIVRVGIVLCVALFVSPCLMLVQRNWASFVLIGICVATFLIRRSLDAFVFRSSDPVKEIIAANPNIQTKMVGKGNEKKRIVFDGFHVMMRNLLLSWSLLNICAYEMNRQQFLYAFLCEKLGSGLEIIVLVFLMVLEGMMFVRYYHYSYLKYKYTFENFVEEYPESKSSQEQKNRIVLEVSYKATS